MINMMLATVGLLIIVVAWVIQLATTSKENNQILLMFVALYTIGALLLVLDGFQTGLTINTGLNFVTLIASGMTLYKLKK
jgi:cytochrome c oxidase assembly factor CtaG